VEVWASREQVEEMALGHGDIVGLRFPEPKASQRHRKTPAQHDPDQHSI
jgi:hypothetical protein